MQNKKKCTQKIQENVNTLNNNLLKNKVKKELLVEQIENKKLNQNILEKIGSQ